MYAGVDFAAAGAGAMESPIRSKRPLLFCGGTAAAGEEFEKKSPNPLLELNPLDGADGCDVAFGGEAGVSKKLPPPPYAEGVAFGGAAVDFVLMPANPANGDGFAACD